MGRDYWSWGRSFRKPSSGAITPGKYKHSAATTPAGCLSGALQVFDLHRLLFTAGRSSSDSLSPDPDYYEDQAAATAAGLLKGVEAPRNSLELDPVSFPAAPTASAVSLLAGGASRCVRDEDDDFEIPFAIQVVPRRDNRDQKAASSSSSMSSPLPPTADDLISSHSQSRGSASGRNGNTSTNVVARLMGLDLLPDQVVSPRTCYANRDALLSPPRARGRSRLHRLRRVSKQQENHQQQAMAPVVTPRIPLQQRSCNVTMADEMRHGTRSLPDTPRMSASSARPSWDSETPRHSLQSHYGWNNKENMSASAMRELKSICEDYSALEPSPPRTLKVSVKAAARGKENFPPKETKAGIGVAAVVMSPRRYAREIVRQAKDSVARRISGSSAGSAAAGNDRDEVATPVIRSERRLRAYSSSPFSCGGGEAMRSSANCSPSPRCSPRVALETAGSHRSRSPHASEGEPAESDRALSTLDASKQPSPPTIPYPCILEQCEKPKLPPLAQPGKLKSAGFVPAVPSPSSSSAAKKSSYDRFTERLKKPAAPSKREARIASPSALPTSSSTTPQPRLRNCIVIRPPSKLQMEPPVALATNPDENIDQAAAVSSPMRTSTTLPPANQTSRSPPLPDLDGSESDRPEEEDELRYVKCVLEKSGIRPHTQGHLSLHWHSPSHPLDPNIFHQLELSSCSINPRGPLQQRCNRKLLFHLVDELLSDILWPQQETPLPPALPSSAAAAAHPAMMTGEALLRRVWSQARSYPGADCQVIQDIDALVGMDLTSGNVRGILRHPAVAEEAGCVMAELELAILDPLLSDSAAAAVEGGHRGWRQRTHHPWGSVLWSPRFDATGP